MNQSKIENAVGALILKENSLLLVKRKMHFTDKWTLPVGVLEFGETAEECIVREVFEELGVEFVSPTFCCFNDAIDILPGRHFVMLYFYGKARGEVLLNNEELREYKYVSIDEVLKMELGFEHSKAVKKFYSQVYATLFPAQKSP